MVKKVNRQIETLFFMWGKDGKAKSYEILKGTTIKTAGSLQRTLHHLQSRALIRRVRRNKVFSRF